ncbi:hypothetical protein [Actinopolyspora xinjiangensis]|nr:hypothetical protein [Actinopolyspora xinjiangensis]
MIRNYYCHAGMVSSTKRFRITCDDTQPLLMRKARLSGPLGGISKLMKPINAKYVKTEADHEATRPPGALGWDVLRQ